METVALVASLQYFQVVLPCFNHRLTWIERSTSVLFLLYNNRLSRGVHLLVRYVQWFDHAFYLWSSSAGHSNSRISWLDPVSFPSFLHRYSQGERLALYWQARNTSTGDPARNVLQRYGAGSRSCLLRKMTAVRDTASDPGEGMSVEALIYTRSIGATATCLPICWPPRIQSWLSASRRKLESLQKLRESCHGFILLSGFLY